MCTQFMNLALRYLVPYNNRMNPIESWHQALRETAVLRPRLKPLETFEATDLPYWLLTEVADHSSRTRVRRGRIEVAKPSLLLPPDSPQFEGFRAEGIPEPDWRLLSGFLLVRGVSFPSFKFSHVAAEGEILEENMKTAAGKCRDRLERTEDISTTLLVGPDANWLFSLLVFVALQAARSAEGDVRKILEQYRGKDKWI